LVVDGWVRNQIPRTEIVLETTLPKEITQSEAAD
jgi:hypothetical protein